VIYLNNRIKKCLGLSLSLLVLVSVMSGCNSKKSAVDESDKTTGPPTTLNVEVFDRAKAGQAPLDNNYWTKYVNDNFGKDNNVAVHYIPVPRTQEVEKLNIMMAANQAPDICFTYTQSVVYNFVKQGGVTELNSLMSKYGQNLTKYLGKDVLSYGLFDGKQMFIPAMRTILANNVEYIRQDWLDKLGMKAPTTTDEFYNTLVAFRDKNPGGVKGVIPWGVGGDVNYNFSNLIKSFWTKMSEEDFAVLPDWQKPGNKEGVKFANKLYNEKLISPDFAIDKTAKQSDSDNSNGKTGFMAGNFDTPLRSTPGIYDNLKKSVPGAVLTPVDAFTNYDGKHYKNQYTTNGMFIIIPKASKNSVQAVKYLNWMADPKVTFFLQNGEEGTGYKLVDGIPQLLPQTGDKQMYSPSNVDYCIIYNGTQLGDPAKNVKAIAKSYPGYEAEATKAMQIASVDAFQYFWFDTPRDSDAKYAKSLLDKTAEMYAKLVTAKPADFDKLYDEQVKEYMANGGQAVKDESIKIYTAMQAKVKK